MNARLKVWLRKRILLLIKKLRILELKIIWTNKSDPKYSSLSPLDNSSENKHYSQALDWALKNRSIRDIKNIALTGPYGSGKSTILKTYYKNCSRKDLKFLFISLATFKEENIEQSTSAQSTGEENNPIINEKNQLLRLIETSILQQIFYHENDNKIPDSRFKKIRSFKFWYLLLYSVIYSLFLISLSIYIHPNFIQEIFKDWKIGETHLNWIHYTTVSIIGLGLFGIIFSSIRILRSVTLQKLNFKNAEIGIGVNQNKSVLNHHIDEILYFFSVRPYNVVVIEDLDRFKQTEIFTKLREINLLLNNSNKTKRKDIVFIYAVRDDMFTDKERTKFFDFIIPVIPIINSSNSAKKLMAKRNEFQYELSDPLIEDVAYYIDDMRLLHNITNEFYLYKELLDPNLIQDKLFAIIAYKNIQPQQFVLLSGNSGKIYDLIQSKRIKIKTRTEELNKEISEIKEEIKRLENIYIDNLEELRLLYIARLLPKLKNVKSFLFEESEINIEDMILEKNFDHLENNELQYHYYIPIYSGAENIVSNTVDIKFKKLEDLVDGKKSYRTRVEEINDLNNNKIKTLINKIEELERKKENLRNLPIAEILQKDDSVSEFENEIALEDILVRNGYIAEDYLDYISLFHDGDISRTDYQFILNLKNKRKQDVNYKLQKTKRVINKINPSLFKNHLILNFDLLEQILENPGDYSDKLQSILEVLRDESNDSAKFIAAYLERTSYLQTFIQRLCKVWLNIWSFFESYPAMENEKKEQLFKWLITYLENAEILVLSKHYDLAKKIAGNPNFPNIIADQKKMRDLLKTLNIKFQEIDIQGTPSETLQYIFTNEHYQINPITLASIMQKFGKYEQYTFENKNYTAIKSSERKELITYVNKNINTYIQSVFLELEKNTADDEATILQLLNNSDIKMELKQKIIGKMDKKITVLEKVKLNEVHAELFNQRKVVPNWENILQDFLNHEEDISEEVIDFLNDIETASIITEKNIPSEGEHRLAYSSLCNELAMVTTFTHEVMEQIAGSISFWFDSLDLSSHSFEQVKTLINKIVIRPTKKTFDYLKKEFNPLHIDLFERNTNAMMKVLNELELDSEDIEKLLGSQKIQAAQKNIIIELHNETLVISNPQTLKHIAQLLNSNPGFTISKTLLDATLLSIVTPTIERIELLLNRTSLDNDFIQTFISTLDADYVRINDKSKRPRFPINDLNRRFLQLLQNSGIISSFTENKEDFKVNHRTK